ncbi:MAG: hypothetical protein WBN18_06200 [Flavobacteriaceae bacterium]
MKKVMVQFSFPNLDKKMYDAIIKDLESAGKGHIPERLYHVAAPNGPNWHVTDVWTSEEAFHRFGETMIPILIKNGGTPVQPIILPVHNMILA